MKEKKLGLPSAISVCVGLIVATSCLVSLGNGTGIYGTSFIISMFVVVVLNIFVGISFAELHSLMPGVTGGTSQYILAGLGPVASIISNLGAYLIVMTCSSTIELSMCGMTLTTFFPFDIDYRIFSLIILVIFYLINLMSIDIFAKIQNLSVYLLLACVAFLGIMGALNLGTGEVVTQTVLPAINVSDVLSAMPIAFWLFIGVEYVIPIAKDLKNPKRDVLLSMVLGLVILFVVQSIMSKGMMNYVSIEILSTSNIPHMIFADNLFGLPGQYIMGFITLMAAVSALNVIYSTVSKILQGMAEQGMLPSVFAKTNKYNAAYIGITFIAVFNVGLIVLDIANTQGITFIILAASVFWLITYCMVHVTVLKLRRTYPDKSRNKKLTLWGIPQIVGIIGNIYMIVNISSGETRIKIFAVCGVMFAVLLIFAFTWVCVVMKAKPFKTVSIDVINSSTNDFSELITKREDRRDGNS